jgi:TonB family protein
MTATLSWVILPNGDVEDIRVDRTSGRPDLDQLAVQALRRVENLGRLPPGLPSDGLRVSLEFEFGGGE